MDKFEKRAPNRYYDDILNVEYRLKSDDRFSDVEKDSIEKMSAPPSGADTSRRHR